MVSDFLLILGVAVLSISLRTFRVRLLQKLGAAGIVATSFLIGWRLTGYWGVGLFCALSWLLLPWLEILTRVRNCACPWSAAFGRNRRRMLRLSQRSRISPKKSRESSSSMCRIPVGIGTIISSTSGFSIIPPSARRRRICLIDQENVAFYYLSLSSRAKDGKMWTTWNYPFSYSLRLARRGR
jgi:hypothetical protein